MQAVRSVIVAGFATLALSFAPSLAQAAQGFIVGQTDLRAGPDEQFPSVDMLPAGAQVEVFGCLSGNVWCDVGFQQDRGWVSGQDLEVMYQSNRVKVVEVQTEVVPVVTFQVATYWDQYYRSKPFFRDRDRFASLNINIENGGKAAPGKAGTGGQAAVTGTINGKTEAGKTETGGAGVKPTGQAEAKCPPGQKNCKLPGKTGEGMNAGKPGQEMNAGKSASGGANANDKTATGGAGNREKTATSGGMTGEKTGSVKPKTGQAMAGPKGCKPGMANCGPAGGGNAGEGQPGK
jgi:uncharacterized protein YraI